MLQFLEGTNCQLIVRDGPRPEIVLQPDLSAAQDLFQTLWHKIQAGLAEIGDLPDFSLTDYTPTFFSLQHWQDRPPLSYSDALLILQQQEQHATAPWPYADNAKNHQAGSGDALARLLSALGVNAGYCLGLKGRISIAFGDSLGYLVTANPTGLGVDFERGMAHRLFWGEGSLPRPFPHPFDTQDWQQARPGFRKVFDQFQAWQETPNTCTIARDQWYRALTAELTTL